MTNPGFTPVPSTATFARFAAASMAAASRRWLYQGYASSSVVETMGFFALRIVSICGATALQRRAGAEQDHVRGRRLERARAVR